MSFENPFEGEVAPPAESAAEESGEISVAKEEQSFEVKSLLNEDEEAEYKKLDNMISLRRHFAGCKDAEEFYSLPEDEQKKLRARYTELYEKRGMRKRRSWK